jgi:hypothetical protein
VDLCTCLVVGNLIIHLKAKLTMSSTHSVRKKGREYARLADQTFPREMHTSNEMASMRLADHAASRERVLDTEVVALVGWV